MNSESLENMNQKQRIFFALNLPEKIKEELSNYQKEIGGLFSFFDGDVIRWTKKENLHITLKFLGYVNDKELLGLSQALKEATASQKRFSLKLTKICYGPLPLERVPRMVWVVGEPSREIVYLNEEIENLVSKISKRYQEKGKRKFTPHITLGRIRQWQWQRIEPEERPSIERDLDLPLKVCSVEIMESILKKGGAEYKIIQSFSLQKN